MKHIAAIAALVIIPGLAFAQTKSAIQYHDSTGQTKTAKTGWQGNDVDGRYFICTPGDSGSSVTVKQGELTAKKFTDSGSGLTDIPAASVIGGVQLPIGIDDVSKLADTPGWKSDTSHTHVPGKIV
jgi:hypothetical protein